jgi:type VI secretion system secreted protein Hcp
MQDFNFTAKVSTASPNLMLACASGKHFKSAVLTARKAGKGQQEFLTFSLSDVLVSAYQTGGVEGEVLPGDSVSLNFSKIQVEYKQQNPDGTLGASIKAGWDVKQNKQF